MKLRIDQLRKVIDLNDVWAIFEYNGDLIILPKQPLYCPICGSELILHDFRCYQHKTYTPELCHCDVHVKCSRCGSWWIVEDQRIRSPATFGLAVPCDLVPKLMKSRFHGNVLRIELAQIYELDEELRKRLESWGYL